MQESKHFEGQVLVAREAEGNSSGGASHVVDTYEPVAGLTTFLLLGTLNTKQGQTLMPCVRCCNGPGEFFKLSVCSSLNGPASCLRCNAEFCTGLVVLCVAGLHQPLCSCHSVSTFCVPMYPF